MDPINVEFSDNGRKRKGGAVLIPPEKSAIKTVISIVIALLTAVIAYYFMLPPMNLGSYKFYTYWAIVLGSYVAATFITSAAFAKPEYVPYVRRRSIVPIVLAAVLALILGVGWLASSPFFRAKSYAKILSIENSDFSNAVSLIDSMSDFNNVALIDKDAAEALADKTLGDFAALDLESQFELLKEDSTQINFRGSPYRVYPLQYGDLFKWFFNSVTGGKYEGIPGYVRVNMNTQAAELITDYDIKYSTAEHFNEYLVRHLRFKYPTYLFGEMSFEIDEAGKPYWVVEHIKKTIGLVGGDDVAGIILVDAVTGESKYYSAEEMSAPDSEIAWIDQAYDSELLVNQYNYFGKYNGGFWNSIIGQSGVKKASVGYSFLAIEDDVYLYTGVTSVTSDDSILGFFLINQRTKEAKFYNTTGATESAAQLSAQGKVSDKQWQASFPILLNIDGQATYFMSLKDASNIVKSYAMVNVQQYNVVAIPDNESVDLRSCLEKYIEDLGALSPAVIVNFNFDGSGIAEDDTPKPSEDGTKTITGVITDIRSAVINGNTYYYFELDNSDVYYYTAASLSNRAALFNVGDRVTVEASASYKDGLSAAKTVDAAKSEQPTPTQPDEPTSADNGSTDTTK